MSEHHAGVGDSADQASLFSEEQNRLINAWFARGPDRRTLRRVTEIEDAGTASRF
jgi:hypothetical protein